MVMCKNAKGNKVKEEIPIFLISMPWNCSLTPFQKWMQLKDKKTFIPKTKQDSTWKESTKHWCTRQLKCIRKFLAVMQWQMEKKFEANNSTKHHYSIQKYQSHGINQWDDFIAWVKCLWVFHWQTKWMSCFSNFLEITSIMYVKNRGDTLSTINKIK